MKTIFITSGEPVIARFFLRSGLLSILAGNPSLRVVLLVPEAEVDKYASEFKSEKVIIAGVSKILPTFWGRLLLFMSRLAFRTVTNTHTRMREHYFLKKNIIPVLVKEFLSRLLGHIRILQNLVRWGELQVASTPQLSKLFAKYQPSLVYATVIVNDQFDIPILLEAKRRGIKTAASTRNWDNFTTFGFILMLPDFLLLQNEFLAEQAERLHGMPKDRIKVVGFPHFDWYKEQKLIEPREVFCRKLGIDPAKKIVLYGAMGDWLFLHEGEIAKVFEELMEQGSINQKATMIFRAHPAFLSPLERMKKLKHVVLDKVFGQRFDTVGDPATDQADLAHFVNSLYHSDIVVTAASTVGLDAVVLGKPLISVSFDGKSKPVYWLSCERFQDHFAHWIDFMKCGGARRVNSQEEFASAINLYLGDREKDAAGRECIRKRFATFSDGKSTERLAAALVSFLKNNDPK